MKNYTVAVRIRVNGRKKSVAGYSSYDSKGYDEKFKNAVLNAVYKDYSDRGKKFKYDTDWDYSLSNSQILYFGGKTGKIPKGRNRDLRPQVLAQAKKPEDKPITRTEQRRELGMDMMSKLERENQRLRKEIERLKKKEK